MCRHTTHERRKHDGHTVSPGHLATRPAQEFQESAKMIAGEARALSRLLNQYADQADQAVKTLVP